MSERRWWCRSFGVNVVATLTLLPGLLISHLATHALRRGLYSSAASRLEFAGLSGSVAGGFT